ncbi:unnamed protein product [Rotaria sordida]|uniref:Uncharacterized protein n=1 Tax=Rotaria sordida TaxID=392033 RepID=A0A813U6T4_9BILA|nr:unnamed protein product [Rotaria sordida]
MVHPQFQTVLGGRPLLYLFQFDDAEANLCGGGWSGRLQNPYMVLMDFQVPTVQAHAALLGFDAISMYALPGGTIEGSPFIDLVHTAQQ